MSNGYCFDHDPTPLPRSKTVQGVAPNRGASGPREGLAETRYRHGAKGEERVYPAKLHEMNRARREAFQLMMQQRERKNAPLLVTFVLDTVMGRVMANSLRDIGWLRIENGVDGRPATVTLSNFGEWVLGGAPAPSSPRVTRGQFVKKVVCGVVIMIATACGGAVSGNDEASDPAPATACERLRVYDERLLADGCDVPPDTAAAVSAGDDAACGALTSRLDACLSDRYCSEDMTTRAVEACHGDPGAPTWRAEP